MNLNIFVNSKIQIVFYQYLLVSTCWWYLYFHVSVYISFI